MIEAEHVERVHRLLGQIEPILAGHPAPVQGAVLADLLATWLAGHIDKGSSQRTDLLREELLRHHLRTVRLLVPVNAAHIHGRGD
jgi:hypothetical protein